MGRILGQESIKGVVLVDSLPAVKKPKRKKSNKTSDQHLIKDIFELEDDSDLTGNLVPVYEFEGICPVETCTERFVVGGCPFHTL